MKIFIGMETSGVTRRAFERAGHSVISCDLLPSQDNSSNHIVGDVFDTLDVLRACGWRPDFALFHPDCTYLTNSAAWAFNDPDFVRYPGVGYHQRVKPGTLTGWVRRQARLDAVAIVRRIWALDIEQIVIENPTGALSSMWMKPTQIIQPYQFGNDANQTDSGQNNLSEGGNRWQVRADTYSGISDAMLKQWFTSDTPDRAYTAHCSSR